MIRRPPRSTLFPTRRSSDLLDAPALADVMFPRPGGPDLLDRTDRVQYAIGALAMGQSADRVLDRKSTRLNSSHSQISYAVFCLKKKKLRNHCRNPPLPLHAI